MFSGYILYITLMFTMLKGKVSCFSISKFEGCVSHQYFMLRSQSTNLFDQRGGGSVLNFGFNTLQVGNICGGNFAIVSPSTNTQDKNIIETYRHLKDYELVHPAELEFVQSKEHLPNRINMFLAGRIALRKAITSLPLTKSQISEFTNTPILTNKLGAPQLPHNLVTGSISHKNNIAVAVAKITDHKVNRPHRREGFIGIDIEKCSNKAHEKLCERLLTDNEQFSLGKVERNIFSHSAGGNFDSNLQISTSSVHSTPSAQSPVLSPYSSKYLTREEETMLRFSFKESVYKAVNPFLQRYVDFDEVQIFPTSDGNAVLDFCLKTREQFEYRAEFMRLSGTAAGSSSNRTSSSRSHIIGAATSSENSSTITGTISSVGSVLPATADDYWISCVYLCNQHSEGCGG